MSGTLPDKPIDGAIAAVVAPAPVAAAPIPAAVVPAAAAATPEPTATPPAVAPAVAAPAPAPVAEPPATAAPAAEPPKATSLLSEPVKPADAALPAADAKPGEQPVAEPIAAPLPSYELKFPEGFEAAPEQMSKFTGLIGEFEREAGGDHQKFSGFAQKALDFHLSELERVTGEIDKAARQQWTDTRASWVDKFKTDPELGGNRQQTTLQHCAAVIDGFGGNAEQRKELREFLGVTGMGDHPAMIRLLSNVAKALGEGRPVPANTPKPVPLSRKERRYPSLNNGAA